MSKAPSISRINPTDNQHFANSSVSIVAAAPSSRINLRATSKGAASFSKSFGLQLPEKPGAVVSKAGKSAFWIGPDEWLIVDEKAAIEDLMPKGAATEVSAVDISHRNVAYALTGPGVANVLNAGCPARPVAGRLSRWHGIANHFWKGGSGDLPLQERDLSSGMLALLCPLCLGIADGGCQGRPYLMTHRRRLSAYRGI